jgi:hypothetical protein
MHSFAFLVSVFMLPKLQAVSHEYRPPKDGDVCMKPVPTFSPHDQFRGFVEISYNIAHVLGLFLYLIEIILLSWVKFWDFSYNACLASTICMIPFLILFIGLCWYFNRVLSNHVYETRTNMLEDVEREYASSEELFSMTPLSASDWSLNHHDLDASNTPASGSQRSNRSQLSKFSSTSLDSMAGRSNKGFVADIHAPDKLL